MKKNTGQQQRLVWHEGILKWQVREVYCEIEGPGWKFWKPYISHYSYGEPKFIDIPDA